MKQLGFFDVQDPSYLDAEHPDQRLSALHAILWSETIGY